MHLIWRPEPFILLLALPESPMTMPCWEHLDAIITAEPLETSLVCSADLQLSSLELWLKLADCAISSAVLNICERASQIHWLPSEV